MVVTDRRLLWLDQTPKSLGFALITGLGEMTYSTHRNLIRIAFSSRDDLKRKEDSVTLEFSRVNTDVLVAIRAALANVETRDITDELETVVASLNQQRLKFTGFSKVLLRFRQ